MKLDQMKKKKIMDGSRRKSERKMKIWVKKLLKVKTKKKKKNIKKEKKRKCKKKYGGMTY